MIDQLIAVQSPEEILAMAEERARYLDQIGADLEKKKDEAVSWRSKIEHRFVEADQQYGDGVTTLVDAKLKSGTQNGLHNRSPDNITFTKVRGITSRIQDMLFPTNDRNWDLEVGEAESVAPVSAIHDQVQGDQAVSDKETYAKKAEYMEKIISDDLALCQYSKVGRMTIADGCKYGTGIIRGPFAKNYRRQKKVINESELGVTSILIEENEIKPAVERIETKNFFPQPSKCIEECDYIFDLNIATKRSIYNLIGQPGFDEAQIKKLLSQDPRHGALSDVPVYGRQANDSGAMLKDRYTLWRYVGPIEKKCLEYFSTEENGEAVEDDDMSKHVIVEAYMSQGVVLKVCELPIKVCDVLPYHVWCYEKDPDCIFGYGVPYRCRHDQNVANVAWSAAQFNAIMSSGPQIGVVKGALESMDGNPDLSFDRPRLWAMSANVSNIDQVLTTKVIPNVTGPILEIYDRAKANADEHTMLPVIAQGEATKATQTASGLALLMNEANIIQRSAAQDWDEQITIPLLKLMVKFEQESGDENLQEPYEVIPKAASHLLVKDMRLQHSMSLLALADNPNNQVYFNREELIRSIVSDINYPIRVLRSREEIKQAMDAAAQQQGDPNAAKAEVERYKADLDAQIRREEMAAEAERERIRSEATILAAEMSRDAALARAASLEQVTIAELQAKLDMHETTNRTKEFLESLRDKRERQKAELKSQDTRFVKGMDAEIKAQNIVQSENKIQAQIASERPLRI